MGKGLYRGIHIKPENRGTFTAYCKGLGHLGVTGGCIKKALSSGDKDLQRKAMFAKNAKKWKHK